jgi:hypothetical protein
VVFRKASNHWSPDDPKFGHSERTIRKRLAGLEPIAADGRTVWFAARSALEAIFLGESLNPQLERARKLKSAGTNASAASGGAGRNLTA